MKYLQKHVFPDLKPTSLLKTKEKVVFINKLYPWKCKLWVRLLDFSSDTDQRLAPLNVFVDSSSTRAGAKSTHMEANPPTY